MERLLNRKRNTILLVLLTMVCVATVVLFTFSMDKVIKVEEAMAQHPLENVFTYMIFGFFELLLVFTVPSLVGTAKYALYVQDKSRTGMVFATGLALVSSLITVLSWLWIICIWSMDTGWKPLGIVSQDQIMIALLMLWCFLLVWIPGLLVKKLVKKLVIRKRCKLDTPAKKRGCRECLQSLGVVFAVFTMAMLLLSLRYAWQIMSCWDEKQLPQQWYIGVIVHGVAGIIAGVELILGIRFILNRSHGKVPVGALLLSSSCLGYFTLWACQIYTIMGAFNGEYVSSYAYANSILCVIVQRMVTPVFLVIATALCKRKKKSIT